MMNGIGPVFTLNPHNANLDPFQSKQDVVPRTGRSFRRAAVLPSGVSAGVHRLVAHQPGRVGLRAGRPQACPL